MPTYASDQIRLHYTEHGRPDGFPVLLIAPGGMRSAAALWARSPWDPRARLQDWRVIAMDQRNAGDSAGPIEPDHGWHTHTADQLALLNALGVDRFHVVGMCIGGAYIASLMRAAPERVASAVMMQPIGLHANRDAFFTMFDAWRADVAADHPEADGARWDRYREAMFGGEYLFAAGPEAVETWRAPVLLLKGDDLYHPAPISDDLAQTLPDVTYVEQWKDPAQLETVDAAIQGFLSRHTPR